jgi:hypothetical protein
MKQEALPLKGRGGSHLRIVSESRIRNSSRLELGKESLRQRTQDPRNSPKEALLLAIRSLFVIAMQIEYYTSNYL